MSSTKDQIGERIGRARCFNSPRQLCMHESLGCQRNFVLSDEAYKVVEIVIQLPERFRIHAFFLTMFLFLLFYTDLWPNLTSRSYTTYLTVSINLHFSHYCQFTITEIDQL